MATEGNEALIHRLIDEGWNHGNLDVVDEVMADNFVHHDPIDPNRQSRAGYKQWLTEALNAFPDFHVTVDDMFSSGEQVTTRWTIQGTHQSELVSSMGTFPASGSHVITTGITIGRFRDGKLVEDWHYWDALGFLVQIGAIPMPGQVSA